MRKMMVFILWVINPLKSRSSEEHLFRNHEPIFRTQGTIYQEPKGTSVLLECLVENLGDNTIVWKQGERVISAGNVQVRKDERMSLVATGHQSRSNLRISNLQLQDAGNYTCEIEWRGQPRQISHLLRVLQPPDISAPNAGANVFTNEGEDIRVLCQARGDPRPSVHWLRKEEGYEQELRPRTDPQYLNLNQITPRDKGEYVCEATNSVGSDYRSIYIHVNYPPIVTVDETRVYSGVGAKVVVECRVEGYPQPVVNWYKNTGNRRELVTSGSNHIISSEADKYVLRLRSVSKMDLVSNYTCEATNEQGRVSRDIELTGRPEPPTINSSPDSLYSESYELVFTVKSFSQLININVKYQVVDPLAAAAASGSDTKWITKLFPPKFEQFSEREKYRSRLTSNVFRVVNYSMDFLQKSTKYHVLVKVENEFGWSGDSTLHTFTTRDTDYNQDYQKGYFGLGYSTGDRVQSCINKITVSIIVIIL